MKRIDIDELRATLPKLLKDASEGDRILLYRGRKAVAALVPVEDARYMKRVEDAYWIDEALKAEEEMKRKGEKPIPMEKVERELDELNARRARKRRKIA